MRPGIPLKHVADIRYSNVDKKTLDGQIPVKLCNYTDVYYNQRIVDEMPFMDASATAEQVAAFTLRADDVLLTKESETADDIGVSSLVTADLPGVLCGYHLAIVRPRPTAIIGRYLRWALVSTPSRQQFEVAATGVTRFGLRQDSVAGMLVHVPRLDEQRAIADYLDAETARIDAIVDSRRRQLILVAERFVAGVASAVSSSPRGRLGHYLSSIEQGWSPVAGEGLRDSDSEWGVLKLSAITGGVFRAKEHKTMAEDPGVYARYEVLPGDLLMTRANTPELVGDVAHADAPPRRLLISDLIYRLRYIPAKADGRYLAFVLSTSEVRGQLAAIARGSSQSMVKLRGSDIRGIDIPIPSLEQQQAISSVLQAASGDAQRLAECLSRQLELLQERRQALITAAVTGQVEIPGVAA